MATARSDEVGDEELVARYSQYAVDQDSRAFYAGWLSSRLLINRCADCHRWHHPPQPICPGCWSTDVRPTEVSGRGIIHLLIRLHQGPPAPGVDYSSGPYPVAVVELEEQPGLRFTTTLVDYQPEDLRIGLAVTLTWADRAGSPFPVFRPAGR